LFESAKMEECPLTHDEKLAAASYFDILAI